MGNSSKSRVIRQNCNSFDEIPLLTNYSFDEILFTLIFRLRIKNHLPRLPILKFLKKNILKKVRACLPKIFKIKIFRRYQTFYKVPKINWNQLPFSIASTVLIFVCYTDILKKSSVCLRLKRERDEAHAIGDNDSHRGRNHITNAHIIFKRKSWFLSVKSDF